jgi:hypothetical protein
MHATLRRDAQRGLRENLSRGDGQRCDQHTIWNHIAEKSQRMQVDSPTRAMADVFDHCAERIASYRGRLHRIEQQVGALFGIDGRVIGLECFGCSDTFGRFFDKLIDSYALDAIESAATVAPVPAVRPGRARGFMESVKKAKGRRHDPVSLGATIAFSSRITAGTALADGETVLHLSAFKKEPGSGDHPVGFQRFSSRRARHLG